MTISQLIESLTRIRELEGDCEVFMEDWSEDYSAPHVVETVAFEHGRGCVLGVSL